MRAYLYILGTVVTLLTGGCATVGESTLLGAGMGAAAGTGIGLASQRSAGSALIGAGIGAALGAGLFYLGHHSEKNKQALLKASFKSKNGKKDPIPPVTMPDVVCYEIDAKIEDSGTKWISPHQICQIKKQSVWSR